MSSHHYDFSIQLDRDDRLSAKAGAICYGGRWLRISAGANRGAISIFIPNEARADRIVAAINAAWDEPATGVLTPFGIRGDVIPLARLDALQGDDTPPEAA